jgi:hypothetical protein
MQKRGFAPQEMQHWPRRQHSNLFRSKSSGDRERRHAVVTRVRALRRERNPTVSVKIRC